MKISNPANPSNPTYGTKIQKFIFKLIPKNNL